MRNSTYYGWLKWPFLVVRDSCKFCSLLETKTRLILHWNILQLFTSIFPSIIFHLQNSFFKCFLNAESFTVFTISSHHEQTYSISYIFYWFCNFNLLFSCKKSICHCGFFFSSNHFWWFKLRHKFGFRCLFLTDFTLLSF